MKLPPSSTPQPTANAPGAKSWRAFFKSRLGWLNPAGRIEAAEPGKELRFTRAAQALHFVVGAVLSFCASFALLTLALWPWHPDDSPLMHAWWPGLLPLPLMAVFLWIAIYCASHAYVILSPVGIEIFPFWFPTENFRLVAWTQVAAVRAENGRLIIDFPPVGQGGGIILDLGPLRAPQRAMLFEAIQRRMNSRSPTPPA